MSGRGPCKLHGGTLPNVIRHHARAEAMEFVVGQLGAQAGIDPLDAAHMAVTLAHGAVEYWRVEIALATGGEGEPTATMREGYRAALMDFARVSKLAIDAGVADQLLADRVAEQIALAAEEALATITLDRTERAEFVTVFAKGLARLSGTSFRAAAKRLTGSSGPVSHTRR